LYKNVFGLRDRQVIGESAFQMGNDRLFHDHKAATREMRSFKRLLVEQAI